MTLLFVFAALSTPLLAAVAPATAEAISVGPDISVSPSPIAFGAVATGHTATQTVTVTNTGGQPLLITSDAVASQNNQADFSTANDTCFFQTINPGNSCTVDVQFTPTTNGVETAALDFNSDATSAVTTGGQTATDITGEGVAPPQPGPGMDGAQSNEPHPGILVTGANPNDTYVNLYDGSTLIGTTSTINSDGTATVSPLRFLADGTYHLTLTESSPDGTGNAYVESDPSAPFTVIEHGQPPVIQSPADGSTTSDHSPTLTVTDALTNLPVHFFIDGQQVGSVTADASGHASYRVTSPLTDGRHSLVVRTLDSFGVEGSPSTSAFTVTTAAPAPNAPTSTPAPQPAPTPAPSPQPAPSPSPKPTPKPKPKPAGKPGTQAKPLTLSRLSISTHTLGLCIVRPDGDDHPDADDRNPVGCEPTPVTLAFTLNRSARVRITIHRRGANGRSIVVGVVFARVSRGHHRIALAQSRFSSGTYQLVLQATVGRASSRQATSSLKVRGPAPAR
ncbi:MAG TPA: choice-of-anchor D domain-containing protein [Solirubrobacteraceae bacterium]|nr:choice-of-anchor D domain-containing protein [Solirubrobacteraceae bacterium]